MRDTSDHPADGGEGATRAAPPPDHVAAMAGAIVEAARQRGSVSEEDFQRAGVPARLIATGREAAYAMAREMEPKLDAMLSGAAT